jgi:predicted transcriptional regulator
VSKKSIIQLSEFDITQKIIESLSNVCTRSVLFSVKTESKDVTKIADELKISLSTIYKTLSTLEDLALVEIDRYEISSEGKKTKLYRSRIGKVEIILENLEPILSLYPNKT